MFIGFVTVSGAALYCQKEGFFEFVTISCRSLVRRAGWQLRPSFLSSQGRNWWGFFVQKLWIHTWCVPTAYLCISAWPDWTAGCFCKKSANILPNL